MKIAKDNIIKMTKAVNRQLELVDGRVNHHRVFKNKKAYDRKQNKNIHVDKFGGLRN